MDPTETLKRIRGLVSSLTELRMDASCDDVAEDGEELASAVNDLDEWLSRGGFLPRQWTEGRS
jgi:hypothetical protein